MIQPTCPTMPLDIIESGLVSKLSITTASRIRPGPLLRTTFNSVWSVCIPGKVTSDFTSCYQKWNVWTLLILIFFTYYHIHLNTAKLKKNTFGILHLLRNSGALYRPLLVSWSSASSIVSSSRWKCITRWRVSIGSTEPGLILEKWRMLFITYPQICIFGYILSSNTNLDR